MKALSRCLRVVIAGDYPENPPNLTRGIQPALYYPLQHLAEYADLELHVVTCEKWRDRPLRQIEVVREARWTVHYLPSSARIPHTLSMLTVDRRAVRRQIEALAPDVIHAHGQAAAYPFSAFDSGLPTVVTVHGINMLEAQVDPRGGALKSRLRTALWGRAERNCLRRARDIVVISPFVQEVISPYTRARLHVIENPVHDDFFRLEPDPKPGKVLLVGSVQKRKGILEAIEALAQVRRQIPNAELHIAGTFIPAYKDYADQVRRRIAEMGAESWVHLPGHLRHADLLEAYRTSQILLFPSWLESSPMAVCEAMASGLPCVVSDIGGTQHLVEEDVAGYRVAPGDVQAFADRVLRLLQDAASCRLFGQRARKLAQERFSAPLAADKAHELYLATASAYPAAP